MPQKIHNILQKILDSKAKEVAYRKQLTSIVALEKADSFSRKCISMQQALLHSPSGIIAEFKRKSPSLGWIHKDADVTNVVNGYDRVGATGISVLTDEEYFGGSLTDLTTARQCASCPLLRKDFVIDEYQLYEAKATGADVVLLIAAVLTVSETFQLAYKAHILGLEVLLEIHHIDELDRINEYIDMIGVNNRNLRTFEQDIHISFNLAEHIPSKFVAVSESGLSDVETVKSLRAVGYKGFLMGENFMKTHNPPEALKQFIATLVDENN